MSRASNLAGFVTSISPTGNLNVGVVTASSFVGNVTGNLTGNVTGNATGLSGTPNLNVGVVTATSFVGSGAGLTGIVLPISVSSFSPASGATGVGVTSPSIVITYNTPVTTGVGTITLRTGSSTGTIVESFDAASSNRISINQAVVTISPTSDLESLTNYYLVVPAGAVVSGNNIGVAITTYNFTSQFIVPKALYIWGRNSQGQLGQNNRTYYSSPVQIPGTTWRSIAAGYLYSVATKTNGTLWAWGQNNYGQLGQNNGTYYSSPIQIPGTTWSSISSGTYWVLATKTDGTLWSWGANTQGQLGLSNRTNYSSPIQIPGTTWNSISAGYFALATKTDGTLWAWGNGGSGRLAQNNLTYYSSPVQIPGTTWSSISVSATASAIASKTDGTLWAWGSNYYGALGQNNRTEYSSPVQIPGTTWRSTRGSTAGANNGVAALKTDGTLWAWGYNTGSLGQNNTTQYSSPVQIPGTTWNFVVGNQQSTSGVSNFIATKTDGTLWAWGDNGNGQLGQSNLTARSSPVQIPGTNWSSNITIGFNFAGGLG